MAMQLSGILDPRTPLQKMGRLALREILLHEGYEAHPDWKADRMRRMIEDNGIDISKYILKTVHNQWVPNLRFIHEITKQRRRKMREEQVNKPAPVEDPLAEIDGLKMPQLRDLAKKLGIKQTPKTKKEDLIGMIKAYGDTTQRSERSPEEGIGNSG